MGWMLEVQQVYPQLSLVRVLLHHQACTFSLIYEENTTLNDHYGDKPIQYATSYTDTQ